MLTKLFRHNNGLADPTKNVAFMRLRIVGPHCACQLRTRPKGVFSRLLSLRHGFCLISVTMRQGSEEIIVKRVIQISCLIAFAQAIPAIPAMAAPLYKPQVEEGEIFVPYVYGGITYNDNVFLLSGPGEAREVTGGTKKSDTILREGVGLLMKLPISLQTLRFDGAIANVDYHHFDDLDHTEGHARLGLDWQVGRVLDGKLSHSYRRDASSFSEFQQPITDLRDIHVTQASGNFKFLQAWRLELGGAHRKVDYDHQNYLDRKQHSVYTGLHYATSVNTQVGVRVRYTDADLAPLPSANGPLNMDYEQLQYRLLFGWEGTRTSYFQVGAGYTRRKRKDGQSEQGGFTGRLTYRWDMTPITRLTTSIYRNYNALDYQISSFVVADGIVLKPSWQVTTNTRLISHVRYEHDEFQGPLVDANGNVVNANGREDNVLSTGLTIQYAATDNLMLSLGADYRHRNSNRQDADYDDTTVFTGLTYAF